MYILTIKREPWGFRVLSRVVNAGIQSKTVSYGQGLGYILSEYPYHVGAFVNPRKVALS